MERVLMLLAAFVAGGIWGAAANTLKMFPFSQVKSLQTSVVGFPEPVSLPGFREREDVFTAFGQPADIVMMGDSLTSIAEWGEMLPGRRIANRGIAGDIVPGMLLRAASARSVNARRIFIMGGINDINIGRPIDKVIADYLALADALGAGDPSRLTIQSTLPVALTYPGVLVSLTEANARIARLNAALQAHAKSRGYGYLDLVPHLSEPAQQGVLSAAYTTDGVHLNAKGYRRWVEALVPVLPPP
jgi:lysophospholipase L1-like esterase